MQIAGIAFPVPILLMVPIRQYLYPYIFGRAFLQDLDPMPGDDDQSSPDPASSDGRGANGPHLDVRDPEVGFDTADPAEPAKVSPDSKSQLSGNQCISSIAVSDCILSGMGLRDHHGFDWSWTGLTCVCISRAAKQVAGKV